MLKKIFSILNVIVLTIIGIASSLDLKEYDYSDNNEHVINSIEILENKEYVDNTILVTLDTEISGLDIDHKRTIFSNFEPYNVEHINKLSNNFRVPNQIDNYKEIYEIKLDIEETEDLQYIMNEIYSLPGVYFVEPSYKLEVKKGSNDPLFVDGELWGLNGTNGVKANDAWDITTGSKDVRVGIIDTGILEHEDLVGNLTSGWNVYSNSNITNNDKNGHGTHVAGTIGAVGNNNKGVVGLNWEVSLVPIQANDGSSDNFNIGDLVRAISYATNLWGEKNQIDILNYSISGYGNSVTIREEVRAYPGLFIWAAGNDSKNIDEYISKNGTFNLPNIISVGAINSKGERWSSSNYSKNNSNVNIYAPGVDITSTVPKWRTWIWESWNHYKSFNGTSMAAPHVTGVAALMLSLNPNLSASEIKDIMLSSSDNITIKIPKGFLSNESQTVKKLNAYKSVKKVSELSSTPHKHNYTHHWINLRQHESRCSCGDVVIRGHLVSSEWNGMGLTICLDCKGDAELGFVNQFSNNDYVLVVGDFETVKQSQVNNYILFNKSVIILPKEDEEKYLNGTMSLFS